MKKQILSFLFVLSAVLLISTSAFAQVDDNTPAPGQTVTYDVTAITGASYQWHIYDSGTSTEATTAYTGSLGTANSITIKWTATSANKSYDIWVQATDINGCLTEPQIRKVDVGTATLCIAKDNSGLGGDPTFGPTGTTSGLCSLIDSSPVISGKGTGTSIGDETTFYATIIGGIPNESYTISYTVSSTISATPTSTVTPTAILSTDGTGAGAALITIKSTDFPSHFLASTTGDHTVTITVTKATSNGVEIENVCTAGENSYTVTVKKLPTISF